MMKQSLFPLTIVVSLLASCGSGSFPDLSQLGAPLEGGYNPLDPPGKRRKALEQREEGVLYEDGALIETVHPSSPLFYALPSGNDQPYAVLAEGVALQVLGNEGSYVKVQTASGQTGYIPDAMVAPQSLLTVEDELLVADLTLNPDGVPSVAPEPEIPSIEPPTFVDSNVDAFEAPSLESSTVPVAPPAPEIPSVPVTPDVPVAPVTPSVPPEPELPSIE